MQTLAMPERSLGDTASDDLFGSNILATRGDMIGENSYAEGIEELNISGLRYPGGTLTEFWFDMSNPDAVTATHAITGETNSFIPISDFMTHAASTGSDVTIVIPTRDQLSEETDENGNRYPSIDEEELRTFVNDVVSGTYGDANVAAFEIGNEYWGSGRMNALEYGRLSSEVSKIIDDELSTMVAEHPEAANVEIAVQMGHNYSYSAISENYKDFSVEDAIEDLNKTYGLDLGDEALFSSGKINWTLVNNEIIASQFDEPEEISAVDAVVTHVYSKGPDNPNTRDFSIEELKKTWDDKLDDPKIYVTEWNQKSNTDELERNEDYGLYQAHEMLNLIETFMQLGVDEAHVWPLIQNSAGTLSKGFDYTGPTPAGEMFALMAEAIPGKTQLDFSANETNVSETSIGNLDVHAFGGDGELLLYFVNTDREDMTSTDISLNNLIQGFGSMDATILGVAEGNNPGSNTSSAELEKVPTASIYENGVLSVDLMPGELMQVRLFDVVPTDELLVNFADVFGWEVISDTDDGTEVIEPAPPEDDPADTVEDEDASDGDIIDGQLVEDDGGSGLFWALGILVPLAFLGGLGM